MFCGVEWNFSDLFSDYEQELNKSLPTNICMLTMNFIKLPSLVLIDIIEMAS